MSAAVRVQAVVLDIEGTTGSLDHVRDVLFPYARRRLRPWLAEALRTGTGQQVLAGIRDHVGEPALPWQAAAAQLEAWSDGDVKAAPLKAAQAAIWREGYAHGELHGHVYPEVPGVLGEWRTAGVGRFIYSSGAESAQRDWFTHTAFGDLTVLIDGYFDLTSAGGKHDPASYRAISRAVDIRAGALLFASDVEAELDAARTAGWQTVAVRRPGDTRLPITAAHPCVTSLDELDVAAATVKDTP